MLQEFQLRVLSAKDLLHVIVRPAIMMLSVTREQFYSYIHPDLCLLRYVWRLGIPSSHLWCWRFILFRFDMNRVMPVMLWLGNFIVALLVTSAAILDYWWSAIYAAIIFKYYGYDSMNNNNYCYSFCNPGLQMMKHSLLILSRTADSLEEVKRWKL